MGSSTQRLAPPPSLSALDVLQPHSFTETGARVEWSARKKDFEFLSDPASTQVAYAEVEERNGVFF